MRTKLNNIIEKRLSSFFDTFLKAFVVVCFLFHLPTTLQVFFFPTSATASVDTKIKPEIPFWPHELSDLKPDPNLIFGKLPNGFRYVLMPNEKPNNRVSMHLNLQVGSLNESEAERGFAHLLEHMQFNGTTHFEPGELVKYFQRIGMQFGPDANAHTSFNETVYDIMLPSGDDKSIAEGLLVMRDFADGALLLPAEIDKERKVVLAEMRSRDSADNRTFEAILGFEFPEALLSRRLPIGIEETLRNADQKALKAFYKSWHRPDKMILVMVGKFNPKTVQHAIKARFGDMQAKKTRQLEPDFGRIHHKGLKYFYHFEREAGNTSVSIENIIEIEKTPDSLALQKKLLFRYLADQILQNRIDAMLNDPDTPFTSADIGSWQFLGKVQYANISAETSPDNWQKSLIRLEKILRTALIYGFQPAELERVRNDFLADLKNAVKRASTRDSRDLARQIIRNLNSNRVLQSPQQEHEIFSPILRQATIEDINSAFRSVWSSDHRLVLVTGNVNLKNDSETPTGKIESAYHKSLKSAASAPEKMTVAEFPYLPPPEDTSRIITRKRIPDLGIEQVDYTNGLRLNLKQTDFKRNQVMINVAFGNGRSSAPSELPGISEFAQAMVNESGLGRLTVDELETALAGKESQVAFSVREENFLISGSTVSDELLLLIQLIYAHLVDPGFRESAYRLSLERFYQRDQAMSKSVDGIMSMAGERFLAQGDKRFGTASFDELKKISPQQIENWVRKGLRATPLEVSIVGDFDIKEAIDAASRYFGDQAFKHAEQQEQRSNKISFPQNESVRYRVDSRIPKSLVVIAFPTDDFWDIHRTRRLSALADLLSERLRVYIREEMGAAYSPYAYNQSFRAYPGYGMLRAQITTNPKEAKTVAGAVTETARQISTEAISADELKRILDPTINSIRDLRQTNRYWLNSVLTLSSRHPQQLEWSRSMEADYRAITAEELSELARQYLREEAAATVIVAPRELEK